VAPATPLPAVDGNFHGTRKAHVRSDAIQVGLANLDRRCRPAPRRAGPTRSAGAVAGRPRLQGSFPRAPSFNPLYSGGLWLPVTATALAAAQFVCGQNRRSGLRTSRSPPRPRRLRGCPPPMPGEHQARRAVRHGPLRSPAVPSALRSENAPLPSACPISRTPSVVRDFPTTPRMS